MFYKIIHADLISDHLRIFEYSYHRYQIYKISVVYVVPQRKFHAMKHFIYLCQGISCYEAFHISFSGVVHIYDICKK